jgi:Fe2+ transport system protein FeoA
MALVESAAECPSCDELDKTECAALTGVPLSEYEPGDTGVILRICGNPDFRLRLMEMGFVKGAEVRVVKEAPLLDPLELVIKGYHLTLRRDEAAGLLMTPPRNGFSAGRCPKKVFRRGWGRGRRKRCSA